MTVILVILGVVVAFFASKRARSIIWRIVELLAWVRDIIRWIIFLPLSFGIVLVYELCNILDTLFLLLFKEVAGYAVSLYFDAFFLAVDVALLLVWARIIAPSPRRGAIIASVACLLMELYCICFRNVCEVLPLAHAEAIDWVGTGVLLGISLYIMYIFTRKEET